VALIGVEMHLTVGQGADRLAVFADIRDQHHRRVIAHELLGVDHRRRPKLFREANLVLLSQLLTAQQNHEVLVPGVLDLREGVIVDVPAQVDADDLGTQCRRQRSYGDARRTKLRVDASIFHATAPSLSCCAPWRSRSGRVWDARQPVLKAPSHR
jgi:hypothetical protein